VTVEEAKKLVVENTNVLDTIEVNLTEATGLILAQDITSPVNLPLFTNSSMDGYALRSKDIKEASKLNPVKLSVVGTIGAGDFPNFSISQNETVKIMTGAPVLRGADSVVMIEDTEEDDGTVKIKKPADPNDNLRFEGEEIKKGEIALKSGVELKPSSIGFIAELGIKKIFVYRKPRVALLVTGGELIGLEEALTPGKIRDTNSLSLSSAVSLENTEFNFIGLVKDNFSVIEEKLKKNFEHNDVVIITGGVSVGEYDFVKDVLIKLGVQTVFWKVAQKPGGPLFFGKKDKTLFFGLPGNPASALVCFYEYIRPCLRKMIGKSNIYLLEIEAILLSEISKKKGKTQFIRGKLEKSGNDFLVKPSGAQGSHILKSFALSDCLIVVEKEISYLPSLIKVNVHLLPLY